MLQHFSSTIKQLPLGDSYVFLIEFKLLLCQNSFCCFKMTFSWICFALNMSIENEFQIFFTLAFLFALYQRSLLVLCFMLFTRFLLLPSLSSRPLTTSLFSDSHNLSLCSLLTVRLLLFKLSLFVIQIKTFVNKMIIRLIT